VDIEIAIDPLDREAIRLARVAARVQAWEQMVADESDSGQIDPAAFDAAWAAAMRALRGAT